MHLLTRANNIGDRLRRLRTIATSTLHQQIGPRMLQTVRGSLKSSFIVHCDQLDLVAYLPGRPISHYLIIFFCETTALSYTPLLWMLYRSYILLLQYLLPCNYILLLDPNCSVHMLCFCHQLLLLVEHSTHFSLQPLLLFQQCLLLQQNLLLHLQQVCWPLSIEILLP